MFGTAKALERKAVLTPGPAGEPSIAQQRDVLPRPLVRTVAGQEGRQGVASPCSALVNGASLGKRFGPPALGRETKDGTPCRPTFNNSGSETTR